MSVTYSKTHQTVYQQCNSPTVTLTCPDIYNGSTHLVGIERTSAGKQFYEEKEKIKTHNKVYHNCEQLGKKITRDYTKTRIRAGPARAKITEIKIVG